MAQQEPFQVTRDGTVLFTGTEDECFVHLLHIQSSSVSHATRYEGYKIEPADGRVSRPSLDIDLSGPDGNIFAVVAQAGVLLSELQKREMRSRVLQSHSYEEALAIVEEYVKIVRQG